MRRKWRIASEGKRFMSATDSSAREIFIVDDDPLVLNALSVVLSREGIR